MAQVEDTDKEAATNGPSDGSERGLPHRRADRERLFSWLFLAVFVTSLGGVLYAIWSVGWLPMGDVGGWIEQMDYMARYDSPHTVYSEVVVSPHPLEPNTMAVRFGGMLGPLMSMDVAAKILISWYALGVPLSLLALALVFGRSRWLALFAVPMVFNALFNVGLLNFLICIPFIFSCMALSRCYAVRGGWWRGLLLAACLVFAYFAHIMGFLIAWGISLAVLVLSSKRLSVLIRTWVVLPGLPLLLFWYVRKFVLLESTETGLTLATADGGFGFWYLTFGQRVAQIHEWSMRFFRDNTDEWFTLVLLVTWASMIVMSLTARTRKDGAKGTMTIIRSYTLQIITLCCILAYFILPSHMNQVGLIAHRVVMIFVWLLALWPHLRFDRWRRRALLVPLIGVSLSYPFVVQDKFRTFEDEILGGMPRAIAALPERSSLAYVRWKHGNSLTHMGPLWHIPNAIHALENGNVNNDSFARCPSSPFLFKKGQTPVTVPNEFWKHRAIFDYDYVLLLSDRRPDAAFEQPFLEPIFVEGIWYLFKIHDL